MNNLETHPSWIAAGVPDAAQIPRCAPVSIRTGRSDLRLMATRHPRPAVRDRSLLNPKPDEPEAPIG